MSLPPNIAESNRRITCELMAGRYDFIDVGTNLGGGFEIGERLGGRRGVGFELDKGRVQWNLDRNRDVLLLDVRHLPYIAQEIPGIRFAVCSHVLEHLPNMYEVGSLVCSLAKICGQFLVISGPCFDSESFLLRHNLKAVHSAMVDHLCKFRTIDLIRMLFDLELRDFVIGVTGEIRDSGNAWIHRADAPAEGLWVWEEGKSLPKPWVEFRPPFYRDYVCVVKLNAETDTGDVLRNFYWGYDRVIFTSTQQFLE